MMSSKERFFVSTGRKDTFLLDQEGFVLIAGMLALFLLSLFGLWALTTSDYETKIASNLQQMEGNFNTSEGAAIMEAGGVGFARTGSGEWYMISDPTVFNQALLPPTADYDPGNDIVEIVGTFPDDFERDDYESWPRQNLLRDNADATHDYMYLATYLYPDTPPPGYDVTQFSGYRFRINGKQKVLVEVGGFKVGVKASL